MIATANAFVNKILFEQNQDYHLELPMGTFTLQRQSWVAVADENIYYLAF